MTQTMIEVCAKALYEEDDPWSVAWKWPNLDPQCGGSADTYRRLARAVLTALLEPTPGMVARGVRYAMNVRIGSPEDPHWPDYIHNMFRAMIQTALTEGERHG
jgi:hypothetical protein